ncbi:ATPase [Micromonospora sp. AKA38]|nr:ATPase [Micromonospora sp. AKA38]
MLVDGLLAGATLAVSLVLGSHPPPAGMRPTDLTGYALTCLLGALLVARQRAPVTVLLLYCAVWVGYIHLGYWPVVNSPGLLLVLYTVGARRPAWTTVPAAGLTVAVWTYAGPESPLIAAVQGVVWSAVVLWVGHGARQLAVRNRQLAGLTIQLRHEQEQRAHRAVVEERLRLARELHDVVAHHLSVVSVQAGLARYVLSSDPDTADRALATVLDTSGEALEELRRLLTVLRLSPDDKPADAGAYAPAPGLAQLDDLVNRMRAAGVPITVTVTGRPRPLPPGADLCAYRVVQEGLTNVLKHAAPASSTIDLRYDSDRFVARVSDDGRRAATATGAATSAGHGLLGMRERAKLYGGSLAAGPRPGGGFEVVLTMPVPGTMGDQRRAPADRDG